MNQTKAISWWQEEYGFFGDFYMEGDNSLDGYLQEKKQDLNQRTETEISGVVSLLDLRPGCKILDVPCGYGRHSIGLAGKGYQVTGLDINRRHLEFAKNDALKKGVAVEFVDENMIDVNYRAQFDCVINMFYSFGFFEEDDDNFQVLCNFFKALKPGGKFLMHTDVNIPRIQNGRYKHNEVRTAKSGKTLKIIDNYNPETKRIDGAWIITDNQNNQVRKDYSVRVYEKDEFVDLCKQAGFSKCEVFSDWSGRLYDSLSEDMIVVATK